MRKYYLKKKWVFFVSLKLPHKQSITSELFLEENDFENWTWALREKRGKIEVLVCMYVCTYVRMYVGM